MPFEPKGSLELAQATIEREHRRYETEVLETLAKYHAEHKRLTDALLSGAEWSRDARRELERRIEFAGNQADRFEKKWDAHVRRIAENPWQHAAFAAKKTCALTPAVIHTAHDLDEQDADVRSLLASSSRYGQ